MIWSLLIGLIILGFSIFMLVYSHYYAFEYEDVVFYLGFAMLMAGITFSTIGFVTLGNTYSLKQDFEIARTQYEAYGEYPEWLGRGSNSLNNDLLKAQYKYMKYGEWSGYSEEVFEIELLPNNDEEKPIQVVIVNE